MPSIYQHFDAVSNQVTYMSTECIPESTLKSHEIHITVKASGISTPDIRAVSAVFHKSADIRLPACQEVAGVVTEVGQDVTSFYTGDRVAGLLPITSENPGCAESCVLCEFHAVKLPDKVSFMLGAASLSDGLSAYTALHYNGRLAAGDTVLIADGAQTWRPFAIQLAQLWGAKVLSTARTGEEKTYLENLPTSISQLVMVSNDRQHICSTVMEETGSLGADVLIDNGVCMFNSDELDAAAEALENYIQLGKHDIISCLSIGARWVTCQYGLQLDPPDCETLAQKSSSVNFFNDQIWTLTGSRKGQLQHILHEIVDKLASGELRPNITTVLKNKDEKALEILNNLSSHRVGKTVIVME